MVKQESKMPGGSKENGPSNSKSSDHSALSRRNILLAGTSIAAATAINAVDRTQVAQAQQPQQPAAPSGRKPNILVIWGDDIGLANISAYSHGLMGYQTPNIDRIGREGMMFLDYYAEQAARPAGRASSPARRRSAPAFPRSEFPVSRLGCRRETRPSRNC